MHEGVHNYGAMIKAIVQELDALDMPETQISVIINKGKNSTVRKKWLGFIRQTELLNAQRLATERRFGYHSIKVGLDITAKVRLVDPADFAPRRDSLIIVMDGDLPESLNTLNTKIIDLRARIVARKSGGGRQSIEVVSQATMRKYWRNKSYI